MKSDNCSPQRVRAIASYLLLVALMWTTSGCGGYFNLSIDPINQDPAVTVSPTPTPTPPTTPPTASWSTSSNSVSESVGTVTLTATLSAATSQNVSIPFSVSLLSTATEGVVDDGTTSISPLVILAGSTSGNVTITINDDTIFEPTETFIIQMGTPVNATAGAITTHTLTVLDDDAMTAFSVTGLTGGIDTTTDAWLLDSANVPTLNWTDSTGESSYDVVIFEQDGTTVKCALVNVAADVTSHTFTGCTLSSATSYKASVTAKTTGQTRAASNNLFQFTTNTIAVVAETNLFGATVPGTIDGNDAQAIELGMRFRTTVAGKIMGVRFYKSLANTGTHTGTLWSSDGDVLATVTFSGETASGWQEQRFSTPVEIDANTTYVISYHSDVGHYSVDFNAFATEVSNGTDNLVRGLADGADGPNGVFSYGATQFPDQSFNSSNYYVDVIFDTRVSPAPGQFTISGVSGGTDTIPDSLLQAVTAPDLTWTESYGAATYEATIYENDGTTVKCPTVTLAAPASHVLFTGCALTTGNHYRAKVVAKDASLTATNATNSMFVFHAQGPLLPVAPMYVQSETRVEFGATSVTQGFGVANTAGNLIVAVCRSSSAAGVLSISDSVGNAYSLVANASNAGAGQISMFYAKNISAGANTVTCSSTVASTIRVLMSEFQGLDTVNPLVTHAANTGNSSTITNAVTTTSSMDLIVHTGSHPSGESRHDGRFLARYQNSGGAFTDRVVPVPGTYTTTDIATDPGTGMPSSQDWIAIDGVFKSAGTTGAPPPALTIVGGREYSNSMQRSVIRSIDGGASWTSLSQFPIAIQSHCTLHLNGGLYVIGGYDGSKYLNSVYRSFDGGLHWDLIGRLPEQRAGHSCVVYGSKMWVLGGGSDDSANFAKATVWSSSDGSTWSSVGTLPYARSFGNAAVFSNRIYYVGGRNSANTAVGTVTSSADGVTWSNTDPPFLGGRLLSHGALFSFNSKLWHFGGSGAGEQDVMACDDPCTSWSQITGMPANYVAGPHAVFNGAMVLVPGGGGIDAVYNSTNGSLNWLKMFPYHGSGGGLLTYTDMVSW